MTCDSIQAIFTTNDVIDQYYLDLLLLPHPWASPTNSGGSSWELMVAMAPSRYDIKTILHTYLEVLPTLQWKLKSFCIIRS